MSSTVSAESDSYPNATSCSGLVPMHKKENLSRANL